MKKITITIIMIIITIGVSGCMFFKNADRNYDKVKEDAQRTLEEKYGEEFAELKIISTTRGPIPGTSFDVLFETYPLKNDEQVFKVYASNEDGNKINDTYYWYLVEDEYLTLHNKIIEGVLSSSNTEYFFYIVNDERKKYWDDISGNTPLSEAMEKQLIKTKLYVFVYRKDLDENELIEIGNNLVKELRAINSPISIRLRSALNEESYQFLVNNAVYGSNELTPHLYMSYTFGNIMDLEKKYRFRYVNKLENNAN